MAGRPDPFVSWYNEEIKKFPERKRQLVEDSPETALRVYGIFGDTQIGQMFVDHYKDDSEYNPAAFHISRDLGRTIDRFPDQTRIEADKDWEIDPNAVRARIMHFCGNPNPSGNFWMDNEWDNIVSAYEEVGSEL